MRQESRFCGGEIGGGVENVAGVVRIYSRTCGLFGTELGVLLSHVEDAGAKMKE